MIKSLDTHEETIKTHATQAQEKAAHKRETGGESKSEVQLRIKVYSRLTAHLNNHHQSKLRKIKCGST